MQPAVPREHLAGGALVTPVAHEDRLAAQHDLAVVGHARLDARNGQADRPEPVAVGPVDVRGGRALGLAVAFEDHDAEGVEEVRDIGREGRPTRDGEAQAAAEPGFHLPEDEPLGERRLGGEARWETLSRLTVRPSPSPDAERPVDQAPTRAGRLGEGGGDARPHLLEQPGHARQDRRRHVEKRGGMRSTSGQ